MQFFLATLCLLISVYVSSAPLSFSAFFFCLLVCISLRIPRAEEIQESERLLIQAYTAWLAEGTFYERESGAVVAELATLLLKHHRLLEAAQLLIRYGWLSFNLGYASRLARLATDEMHRFDWRSTAENE